MCFTNSIYIFMPPVRSNGRSYKMVVMFYSFFSPTVLWVPSTDRPETLPPDRNLCVFYNASPKIRGGTLPPKIRGPKTCKISVDFGPLQILIANVSGTARDIQNRPTVQTMAIAPAFDEKSPVNIGPPSFARPFFICIISNNSFRTSCKFYCSCDGLLLQVSTFSVVVVGI